METLKILSTFLTPLIVLILGLLINKKLDKIKLYQSKEKDWKSFWASKFLEIANDYSQNISSYVTGLSILGKISEEKNTGWEIDIIEQQNYIKQYTRKLQYLEWEIQNYVQFAPNQKDKIMETSHNLFSQFAELMQYKKGDLEEIRKVQFLFNELVRLAHAEILGLEINV